MARTATQPVFSALPSCLRSHICSLTSHSCVGGVESIESVAPMARRELGGKLAALLVRAAV